MPISSLAAIPPLWFENAIVDFLRSNVAVVIPLFILFLKIVVLRISGDVEELIHSLVIMRMEVLLIAIGFVLAGLSRTVPFESRLLTDTRKDLTGAVLLFIISIILAVMYRVNKRVIVYFERFSVAMEGARLPSQQGKLVLINSGQAPSWKMAWAAAYFLSGW